MPIIRKKILEISKISRKIKILFCANFRISPTLTAPLQQGVAAIFGPDDPASAVHAANICDTKEIPYIDTRFDQFSQIPIVNLYPDAETLSQMVVDLVQSSEWTSFTILYETPEWLPRTAKLLELYDPREYTVTVRRLDLRLTTKDYRSILRRIKQSSDNCIVIECSIESLGEILRQAQQIGLLIDKYQFIITNLDAHTIDLEPFQYGDASITLVQMVDTSNDILLDYAEYLKKRSSAEKTDDGKGDAEGEGGEKGEEGSDGENKEEDGEAEQPADRQEGDKEEGAENADGDGEGGQGEHDGDEKGDDGGEGGEKEEGGEGEEEESGTSDGEDGEESASESSVEEAGRQC